MKKSFYYVSCVLYLQSIAFSSETPFPSDAQTFSPTQRQEAALASLIHPNRDAVGVVVQPIATIPQKQVVEKKHQGVIEGGTMTGNVKQTFGKAVADKEVKQGDVSNASIHGILKQTFGKADAKDTISQGNLTNTSVEGDIEQTFGDDD